MKTLLILPFLIFAFSHSFASSDHCKHSFNGLLSVIKGNDYSKSFEKRSPFLHTTYFQSRRLVEFESLTALKKSKSSEVFKKMIQEASTQSLLDNNQVETIRYNFINPATLTREDFFVVKPSSLPENVKYQNMMYEQYLQSLKRTYIHQFNFSEQQLASLRSETILSKDRSVLISSYHQGQPQGGVIAVFSDKSSDLLPLEAWTNKRVIRKENESIAELGRFTVVDGKIASEQETANFLLSLMGTLLNSKPTLNRVVIHAAGPVQERMFARYGFKRIQQTEKEIHDFSKHVLMEVTPSEFRKRNLDLLK